MVTGAFLAVSSHVRVYTTGLKAENPVVGLILVTRLKPFRIFLNLPSTCVYEPSDPLSMQKMHVWI